MNGFILGIAFFIGLVLYDLYKESRDKKRFNMLIKDREEKHEALKHLQSSCAHKNIYGADGKLKVIDCPECMAPVWMIAASKLCVKPGGCREGKGLGICQGMDSDKPWCV